MSRREPPNDETTRRAAYGATASEPTSALTILTVLSHPDPRRIGERAVLSALDLGRPAELSRTSPSFAPSGSPWDDRPLDDPYLSRKPWQINRSDDGLLLERGRSSMALRLEGAPISKSARVNGHTLSRGVTLELEDRVCLLLHNMPRPAFEAGEEVSATAGMVGASAGLLQVLQAIDRVARLEVPVLLRGESGTGKELAARALHERSRRAQGPFVAVDLGVLSPALAASELFGHAKGAFTGAATAKDGYFRAAEGGTLFLDEVGEATMEVQAMLLRVLETRQVMPVGSHTPRPVDVRLVAATDSDLEARARRGDFKEPLIHRLAAYVLELPPLRERRDDIGRLLVHFARPVLRELGEEHRLESPAKDGPPWLPPKLVARLVRAPWTGNIRQLANVVRQLIIDSQGLPQLRSTPRIDSVLTGASPTPSNEPTEPSSISAEPAKKPPRQRPSILGDAEVEEAMRACNFEPAAAARRLGIRRPSLYNLIRRHPTLRLAQDIPEPELHAVLEECGGDVAEAARRLEVSGRALGRRVG